MAKFFVKRILTAIVQIFVVTTIVFFALQMMPGDPVLMMLSRDGSAVNQEAYDALEAELGLTELAWTAVEGGARTVVLAHLSHENNTPARAHEVVRGVLERRGAAVGWDVALEVAPRSEKSRRYTV